MALSGGTSRGLDHALRQLLLLRHAKSLWDDPRLSDHARPLNSRGRAAAQAMRQVMRAMGLAPDLVLVSSARRTLQTLEALGPWDELPLIEPMDALYLASAGAMLDVLHDVSETVRSVLLIGHNPGMHELAVLLADPRAVGVDAGAVVRLAEGYPTGALAEFSIMGPWATLGRGGARLQHFLAPADVPEAAG